MDQILNKENMKHINFHAIFNVIAPFAIEIESNCFK